MRKLSYANVTATMALFVALGGTGYAVTSLPKDSVGNRQLRSSAVGPSELRKNAVSTRSIRDRTIRLQDISASARTSLRGATGSAGPAGPAGPPSVTYRAVVNAGGGVVRGNATTTSHQGGSGVYSVSFPADVSACVATATLSDAPNGPGQDVPTAGRVTVGLDGPRLLVRTFAVDGQALDQPFSVIASC